MAQITFKGNPIHTNGELPTVGTKAPEFELTASDLSSKSLNDYAGKYVVLNIFPSVDTEVCAQSVRTFNQELSSLENTVVLCISKDLPFAQSRFCGAEGLNDVISLADYKSEDFVNNYGVKMIEGPLAGLHSRAVVVVSPEGEVIYTEQVPEIAQEPSYEAAIAAIKG